MTTDGIGSSWIATSTPKAPPGSTIRRRGGANPFRRRSDYHAAAQGGLEGRAPLMAIREGYHVMLQAANEALALAGFKTRTHECTLLGVRELFDAPGLADMLRRAYRERRNVDYFMDPENPELEEFVGPEQFVDGVMTRSVDRVEAVIEREDLR